MSRTREWLTRRMAVVILATIASFSASANASDASSPTQHVLVLNAYDAAYGWTTNTVAGIRSVFDPMESVDLSIEFMDSKKIFTREYAELLAQLYARKYGSMRFDLIVSSDDDALDFLKTYRDRLFPGVPIVFCGVNNFREDRIAGMTNVTGVKEQNDFDRNFEWIARLRPATRDLLFVVDQSATSRAIIREVSAVQPRWAGRFNISFTPDLSVGELEQRLRTLPPETVVFWGMFMRDRTGTPLSMAASHKLIVNASPVPVFGFTDVSVSHGAVGGYVVSAFTQGASAARLGARILAGTSAADIPVQESPNVYTADYAAFQRWQMDAEHLPPGAVVKNPPFSFYQRYRAYVWAALGGMGVESLAILGLIVTIRSLTRKSRAKLRESEERYRSIVEDGSELICRFDHEQKIVFANGAMSRLAGMPADAPIDGIVGRSFWSVLGDLDQDGSRRRLGALTPEAPVLSMEQPSGAAPGDRRWVLWTYRGLFGTTGQLTEVQAVGHDITVRREAELARQAALQKVEEGNARLARSNESLQRILDSMHEGLLVCDRKGVLTATRSRALVVWFGEPAGGALIWEYLFEAGSRSGEQFQLGFEQLCDDVLPFEMAASQLPQTWRRGERSYGLACQPVICDGQFTEVLLVIEDITARVAQDVQLQRNQELTTIIGNVIRNRESYRDFIEESEELLATLSQETDPAVLRRALHTLKGTTATYGLLTFAGHCHALEDAMQADSREPTRASLEALAREWEGSSGGVTALLKNEDAAGVHLSLEEYDDFLSRLGPHALGANGLGANSVAAQVAELLETARGWANPPLAQLHGLFAQSAQQVARTLGKEVAVEVLDHGLRLPRPELRSFFSTLVHVARNCVDHGIEGSDERERSGKVRAGRVTAETRVQGGELTISIRDDGQGIDWEAIRRRAALRSLPASSMSDLVDALFADGLSTRADVSETSGRGVGLGAVRRSCESLGGSVEVTSQRGTGARFEFRFPLWVSDLTPPAKSAVRVGAPAS